MAESNQRQRDDVSVMVSNYPNNNTQDNRTSATQKIDFNDENCGNGNGIGDSRICVVKIKTIERAVAFDCLD